MGVFLGLPAAMLLTARRSRAAEDERRAAYAAVSALVMIGFWIAPSVLAAAGPSHVAGLLQRIAVIGGFQWLVVTAVAEVGVFARLLARAPA